MSTLCSPARRPDSKVKPVDIKTSLSVSLSRLGFVSLALSRTIEPPTIYKAGMEIKKKEDPSL